MLSSNSFAHRGLDEVPIHPRASDLSPDPSSHSPFSYPIKAHHNAPFHGTSGFADLSDLLLQKKSFHNEESNYTDNMLLHMFAVRLNQVRVSFPAMSLKEWRQHAHTYWSSVELYRAFFGAIKSKFFILRDEVGEPGLDSYIQSSLPPCLARPSTLSRDDFLQVLEKYQLFAFMNDYLLSCPHLVQSILHSGTSTSHDGEHTTSTLGMEDICVYPAVDSLHPWLSSLLSNLSVEMAVILLLFSPQSYDVVELKKHPLSAFNNGNALKDSPKQKPQENVFQTNVFQTPTKPKSKKTMKRTGGGGGGGGVEQTYSPSAPPPPPLFAINSTNHDNNHTNVLIPSPSSLFSNYQEYTKHQQEQEEQRRLLHYYQQKHEEVLREQDELKQKLQQQEQQQQQPISVTPTKPKPSTGATAEPTIYVAPGAPTKMKKFRPAVASTSAALALRAARASAATTATASAATNHLHTAAPTTSNNKGVSTADSFALSLLSKFMALNDHPTHPSTMASSPPPVTPLKSKSKLNSTKYGVTTSATSSVTTDLPTVIRLNEEDDHGYNYGGSETDENEHEDDYTSQSYIDTDAVTVSYPSSKPSQSVSVVGSVGAGVDSFQDHLQKVQTSTDAVNQSNQSDTSDWMSKATQKGIFIYAANKNGSKQCRCRTQSNKRCSRTTSEPNSICTQHYNMLMK